MRKIHWVLIWIFCIAFWNEANVFGDDVHVIKEIPPIGIFINEPGTYVFEKNITWNPTSDATAITIQANDVTLNMQGYTLKSSSSSSNLKTIGISAIFSENLKIINGKVKDMGLTGVQCTGCFNVSIKNILVDGLSLEDVTEFIVPTGILTSLCLNVSIDKCAVKNISVKTASTAAIQLTASFFSEIKNCKIKNILNKDGASTGIGHLFCSDALVYACELDSIQSKFINNLNTEGHTAIGIIPVFTSVITIQKCSVSMSLAVVTMLME